VADQLRAAAGQTLGGAIDINDVPLVIEHNDAVVDAVDNEIPRDGYQTEQAMAVEAPDK
jgi:hypothetical protein